MKAIGILGHVGNGNLGDEALFAAAIQNARDLYPEARIVGFSMNPSDSHSQHGIECYPLRHAHDHPVLAPDDTDVSSSGRGWRARVARAVQLRRRLRRAHFVVRRALALPLWSVREMRFLFASYRVVGKLDAVVVAGSGQLNEEWGGAWGFPYTLFKWSCLARLAGARMAYLSVGATELRQPLSGWFVGKALELSTYRSYRDAGTKRIVSELLPTDAAPVVPDLAFSLHLPAPIAAAPSGNRIAINPMALYDGSPWPHADAQVSDRYCEALIQLCGWLSGRGFAVELFTSQHRIDVPMAERIIAGTRERFPGTELPLHTPATPEQALRAIATFDYVVGTRFHGILFSLLLHKPVVALSYERKARQLMASVGQGDAVIDVSACSFETLRDAVETIVREREERSRQIAASIPGFRDRLRLQYLEAFGIQSPMTTEPLEPSTFAA